MRKATTLIIILICVLFVFGEPIKSNLAASNTVIDDSEEAFENPYVTDGLVAMWDAEWNVRGGVHDANSPIWRDVVSGIEATPHNYKQSADYDFSWGENSLICRHCNIAIDAPIITDTMNLTECTYEFGLTRRAGTSRFYFLNDFSNVSYGTFQNSDNQFYTIKGANNVRVQTPWANRILVDTTVVLTCVFSNGNRYIYWNGNFIKQVSVEEATSKDIAFLFGSTYVHSDFTTCADIYHVRIYAKALTAEEVWHNYLLDKERFGL